MPGNPGKPNGGIPGIIGGIPGIIGGIPGGINGIASVVAVGGGTPCGGIGGGAVIVGAVTALVEGGGTFGGGIDAFIPGGGTAGLIIGIAG